MASGGKRAGTRRGPRRKRSFSPSLLGLAAGVTLAVVAWGYLVYAAIDFGTTARSGNPDAWWFLAIASLGAVACLFVGLMMIARLLRRLGLTRGRAPAVAPVAPPPPPLVAAASSASGPMPRGSTEDSRPVLAKPVGGRRIAR